MILASFLSTYWWQLLLLIVCLIISAFFSSAELAYTCANRLRLKKDGEKGEKSSLRAYKITEDFDRSITAILFGNNLVNIACSSLATVICLAVFKTNEQISEAEASTISSIIVLIFLIIFGEVIPKNLGTSKADQLSKLYALPIQFFKIIFAPITYPVSWLVKGIVHILPKKKEEEPSVTDEELIEIVDTIEEEGVIDQKQGELLKSAIDFTDTAVYEIMTPRVEVFAFDIEDKIEELITDREIFLHSRIPVYEDSLDNIIGILSTKILLKTYLSGKKVDVRKLMREPMFVHKAKSVSSLLKDLKEQHQHLAVIKDEFGGTMGIVTMEDIVEELVGDIWDETDRIEEEYQEKEDGVYIVDGAMNIEDFFDLVGYEEEVETEYTTVGGWVIENLERFAKKGDTFDFANLTITVLKADEFTVEEVKVEVEEEEE